MYKECRKRIREQDQVTNYQQDQGTNYQWRQSRQGRNNWTPTKDRSWEEKQQEENRNGNENKKIVGSLVLHTITAAVDTENRYDSESTGK